MTVDEIKAAVLGALKSVAPEADPSALSGGADLREALDIDSMDFLRFVTYLHDELHVDIPERDYGRVRTLDACVSYIAAKLRDAEPRA
jgi:acyl carrier protein